ncbi:MAG: hypothetical protein Q4D21_06630 [Phascolarctobacterium sp.]|nr:hypothetical protein [Phascolarctobacterium sp.]
MTEEKLYYSLKEVRSIVYSDGVSITTLRNMAEKGLLPTIHVLGRIFVPKWWVLKQYDIATNEQSSNIQRK